MDNLNNRISRFSIYLGYGDAGKILRQRIESAAGGNLNRFIVDAILEHLKINGSKDPSSIIHK